SVTSTAALGAPENDDDWAKTYETWRFLGTAPWSRESVCRARVDGARKTFAKGTLERAEKGQSKVSPERVGAMLEDERCGEDAEEAALPQQYLPRIGGQLAASWRDKLKTSGGDLSELVRKRDKGACIVRSGAGKGDNIKFDWSGADKDLIVECALPQPI